LLQRFLVLSSATPSSTSLLLLLLLLLAVSTALALFHPTLCLLPRLLLAPSLPGILLLRLLLLLLLLRLLSRLLSRQQLLL
jgi:hypothetical protein